MGTDVTQPEKVPDWRALLRRYGVRPSKRLGQHFLFSQGALMKVVEAADLQGWESVLEIGAGVGSLTLCLARVAERVVAVEIDARLIPALREVAEAHPKITIVHGDILKQDLGTLMGEGAYSVVANIPYNITSLLIRRMLEAPQCPDRIVLTIQREVAERIVASPGGMSLLALSVRLYGSPRIMARIPAGAFYPKPKVDSAVMRVDLHPDPKADPRLIPLFFRIARAGFQQKRKQLRNALASGLTMHPDQVTAWLEGLNISPKARAQELNLEAWVQMAETFGQGSEETT
ncbi:MAG: 16S rRNA (adenine(1518)-N(6)/adenine(1519)-N(6))-dimethyltransferase RsmA [Anaerolineales bacterium]|jgi:16S rRNA (adenine1518-N6/adenine1519-N6)-dimethyltransferase